MGYTKKLISEQIRQAKIPFALRQEIADQILNALRYLRMNEKTAGYSYCPKTGQRIGLRVLQRRRGRPHFRQERTYLLSTLFRAWERAFGKRPRVNRRGELDTTFVIFVEPILEAVGISNVLDNLNKYRTYYNRLSRIIDRRGGVVVQMN